MNFFMCDCLLMKEIQTRNGRGYKEEHCTSSKEDLGAS